MFKTRCLRTFFLNVNSVINFRRVTNFRLCLLETQVGYIILCMHNLEVLFTTIVASYFAQLEGTSYFTQYGGTSYCKQLTHYTQLSHFRNFRDRAHFATLGKYSKLYKKW